MISSLGTLAGVEGGADVLEGGIGEAAEIGVLLDTECLEARGNLHSDGQLADTSDGGISGLGIGETEGGLTEGLGNVSQTVGNHGLVVVLDVGEKDGIADTVGEVVHGTELVGHGVDVAEAGAVEGHTGEVLGIAHTLSGGDIVTVEGGSHEVLLDETHGLKRAGISDVGGTEGAVGLDGVGEGVHTSGGGDRLGELHHHLSIVNGDGGGDGVGGDHHLHLTHLIGDDGEAGDLGGGTGSGVDGNAGVLRLLGDIETLVVVDLTAVGLDDSDTLGAVLGTTTTNTDDAVGLGLLEGLETVFDVLHGGVGLHIVEDGEVGDTSVVLEGGEGGLNEAGGDDTLVGHDKGVLEAEGLDLGTSQLEGTGTDEGDGRDVEGGSGLVHLGKAHHFWFALINLVIICRRGKENKLKKKEL
ncbi:hypothetical protein AGDE_04965 [Angomonas deanei]|nr:hypothetical protein AGDE_04965 [Angomonas deanei]|eukprot:EPY38964.1 hypothetical protein AGDE_04965 [Angomonas deanei]